MTIPKSPRLVGKKEIKAYCRRSWPMLRSWIMDDCFPAWKIDGCWEGDCRLIDEWYRQRIIERQDTE